MVDGYSIYPFAPLCINQVVATLDSLPLGKQTLFALSNRLWLSYWHQCLPTLLAGDFARPGPRKHWHGSTPFRWLLRGDVSLPCPVTSSRISGAVAEFAFDCLDDGATFWCVLLLDGYRPIHSDVKAENICEDGQQKIENQFTFRTTNAVTRKSLIK